MALTYKIVIKDVRFARDNNFKPNYPYRPQAMDEEGYYLSDPINDMSVLVPFKYAEEVYN